MFHLSHPTGNRNVREALAALESSGQLGLFTTMVAWRGGVWNRLLPSSLVTTLQRKSYSNSILAHTKTHATRDELAKLLSSIGLGKLWTSHETGPLSFDALLKDFDQWAARQTPATVRAVYCYEDSSRDTFQAAKSRGLKCIYEHPVGYWRYVEKLFGEENERSPEYRPILSGLQDSPAKRARKDEEIGSADLIILASNYSLKSLSLYPGTLPSSVVIPYGSPTECAAEPTPPTDRLRVIFVGGLSQIKGLSYLVNALTRVKELVDVTIVGRRTGDCPPLDQFLNGVRWIESVPHARVLELMRECDVLILPSLSDGFGLVVLEAMSQGLTTIVSDHAGVADVVEDGVNGFIIPVRGVDQMVDRLETLAANPDRLASMKAAALTTAAQYTWDRYRASLLTALSGV
jgi:glycosyltransferase involved in cell wall biosynthesis